MSQQLSALKRNEGERLLTRRRWERGELARSVRNHLPFMYAKAFLFALDSIVKALRILAASPVPSAAAEALQELESAVPDITLVRNTAQHHEDRVRGLAPGGKPLDTKPIDNRMIKSPGSVGPQQSQRHPIRLHGRRWPLRGSRRHGTDARRNARRDPESAEQPFLAERSRAIPPVARCLRICWPIARIRS